MVRHLTHQADSAARRIAAYAHRDDCAFMGILGTLIVLWMLGIKLLVG